MKVRKISCYFDDKENQKRTKIPVKGKLMKVLFWNYWKRNLENENRMKVGKISCYFDDEEKKSGKNQITSEKA